MILIQDELLSCAVLEEVHIDGLRCQEVVDLDSISHLAKSPSTANSLLIGLVESVLGAFMKWRDEHDVVGIREVAKMLSVLL